MKNLVSVSMFVGVALATPSRADQLPPPPVHSPEEQQKTFRFAEPGYRIELVASDPMVQDPVAIKFDGDGRLWVVEMRGYMRDIDRSDAEKPDGRISVLEDTNGDGVMDKSTVFADDLILPRTISIQKDGVLIGEHKALSFLEDLDGDLKYDRKTVVDPDYARDNIEHSVNGLLEAMDNWIYNAKEGHRYRKENGRWKRHDTEARGQWGICQDDLGRLFYNYNHSQLHGDLVPPNWLNRNTNHEPSTGISVGISSTNRVFPIRETPAANRGYIPGALDAQGRIKEFTSACSPLIYRGDLFPEFKGNSFVCETVGNLIKRSVLEEKGVYVSATSAYEDRDFLASTDERFRPCGLVNGPDGAIYVVDMYRGIVQDGPIMSPYLREHTIARKMDSPVHKGRIWRIVPEKFNQPDAPLFSEMRVSELVKALENDNGWWRDQAQHHLVALENEEAIPALCEVVKKSESELAKIHALWALEGLGFDAPEALVGAIHDASTKVQVAAFRVLYSLGLADEVLVEMIPSSPPDEVALTILLIVGDLEVDTTTRFQTISNLLASRVDDPLFRDATMSSLFNRELGFLEFLWKDESETSGRAILFEMLSAAIAKSKQVEKIARLEALISRASGWRAKAVDAGIAIVASPMETDDSEVRPLKNHERERFARGRQIYLTSCIGCHGNDGKGIKFLAPPLAGSDWVTGSEERLVRVLFHGVSGPITVSGKRYTTPEIQAMMPPLANMNNGDIAAALTYIRREWGNNAEPLSKSDVTQHRIKAQGRTVPWTEAELEPFALIDEKKNESKSARK